MELMPKIIDSHFLIKIIRNEATDEEKQLFDKWLNESDDNKEEFGTLVLLWKKVSESNIPPIPDQDLQWEKIQNKLTQLSAAENTGAQNLPLKIESSRYTYLALKNKEEKNDYSWVLKVAAVFIIFVSVSLLLFLNKSGRAIPQETDTHTAQTEILYQVETERGVRKTILLPDGSLVYLNVDSKLIYPEKFTDTSRIVQLEGEGYFSVSHDPSKPFSVVCGNTVTVVKGTEFNIKSRNDKVRIVITQGIVETFIKDSSKGIRLKKGEMITFDEKIGFGKPTRAKINHFLAWRKGKFSFAHTSLADVMDEISRFYNVQVVFQNPSERSKMITGVFDADSLEHIFSIISLTLDVKIDLDGSKVIVQ